ncbi:aminoacetone oxidase family FAD-binding enzyme [Longimicrobium sp.]|uniref:NAD(P)/FAD-dependent oxidoreductase n=1 Tax=Longimicrobium sp. TaxID=2029185 RepID=UPI002E36F2C7|nr:aminoacetone oxidase family FAD-binding enzyme [Longimicrobium sp.]HEX6041008.1 aminoacetone oxidase family FAD-binding enzyme [Longimicrobium sp.]
MTDADLPIVVVGAGAAGTMAAIFAAAGGRRTLLVERTRDGGRKILISGGGRCNVLPSEVSADRYFTESSRNSLKKMLLSWPLAEQRRFFEDEVGVPLALEPETGKLFPESNRARDVRDGLIALARRRGAETRFDTKVVGLRPPSGTEPWKVLVEGGEEIAAAAVVLATGGLSVPATGSDGTGFRIARQLGHGLHETYAALTPLTANPPVHAELAGVSLEVTLDAPLPKGSLQSRGGFLFTHRGYSGPTVLNVSHLAVRSAGWEPARRQPVYAQWTSLDARGWEALLLEAGPGTIGSLVRRQLPQRLADRLLEESGVDPERTRSQLRREERARLVEALARYRLPWTGDEGYKKAEVTGGGVPLGEVDPRTGESRVAPGLFLCGEILDCFGPIGGYNFSWAWATGRAAGLGAAASLDGTGA